jgi:hypothetical protein
MAIDRLTAYIISSRKDIIVTAGGPNKDGKWMGWITLSEQDEYRELLNTEELYNSKKEAINAMTKVYNSICDFVKNETKGKEMIDHVMWKVKEESTEKDKRANVNNSMLKQRGFLPLKYMKKIVIFISTLVLVTGCVGQSDDSQNNKKVIVNTTKTEHTTTEHYDGGYEKWEKTEKYTH